MNFRFSRALPTGGLSLTPGREAFHPMDAAGPDHLICPGRAGPLICLGRAGDACVLGALERVGDTLYGARVYGNEFSIFARPPPGASRSRRDERHSIRWTLPGRTT